MVLIPCRRSGEARPVEWAPRPTATSFPWLRAAFSPPASRGRYRPWDAGVGYGVQEATAGWVLPAAAGPVCSWPACGAGMTS